MVVNGFGWFLVGLIFLVVFKLYLVAFDGWWLVVFRWCSFISRFVFFCDMFGFGLFWVICYLPYYETYDGPFVVMIPRSGKAVQLNDCSL